MLARKRFWEGIACVLVALAWLVLGRGLEFGTPALPGPGAFPAALALALLLYGTAELFRAGDAPPAPEAPPPAYLSRSPLALLAAAVAIAAAGFAFVGSLSADLAGFGPTASLAWHTLVLVLGAVAAALAPLGSPRRALGAVLLGLVLGTSGVDPVTPALVRFASAELGLGLTFVHGLLIALAAHRLGFNGLLMALALALSAPIEKALRQGSLALLLDRPFVLALVAAGVAVLVVLASRRERPLAAARATPAAAPARRPLLERRSLWGGAATLAVGVAALRPAAGIDAPGAAGVHGAFGPGAAPLALSAALALLGAVKLALALWRPTAADPPPAPLGAPATIGGIVLVAVLIVLLLVVPLALFATGMSLDDLTARFGPPELAAAALFIVALSVSAAWLMPRGTPWDALGAAVAGLLLGTLGVDPATGVVRYAVEPELAPAHGLAIGYVAWRIGFNPVLIAIGFLYGPYLESNLLRSLILSRGDAAIFVEREISAALVGAAVAVLAAAAGLRRRTRRRALSPRRRAP
jgi:TctA family transporter